jgi:hypothetical protein
MPLNPFNYSEPAPPGLLLDRDHEAKALLDRAFGGHNSRVVAPRRYGKTSLLLRVGADAQKEGWASVYVNFFGVISRADVADRIERAYDQQLHGALGAWFQGIRRTWRPTAKLAAGPFGAELSAEARGQDPLFQRLALPVRLYEKRTKPTLIVFDEFQDVLAAGSEMDSVIRSEIEQHGHAASYIFAGSHVGMMSELFTSKRRAFYGQAGPVDLGPLRPDDVSMYLERRFRETGREIGTALGPLLDVSRGHPQRTILLSHFLWERVKPQTTGDEQDFLAALDRVLEVEIRDELRAIWNGLPVSQRRVLVAIAENAAPLYSAANQRQFGGSRGGSLKSAVTRLLEAGEVVENPTTRSGYAPVDPLLAYWVRAGRSLD